MAEQVLYDTKRPDSCPINWERSWVSQNSLCKYFIGRILELEIV